MTRGAPREGSSAEREAYWERTLSKELNPQGGEGASFQRKSVQSQKPREAEYHLDCAIRGPWSARRGGRRDRAGLGLRAAEGAQGLSHTGPPTAAFRLRPLDPEKTFICRNGGQCSFLLSHT